MDYTYSANHRDLGDGRRMHTNQTSPTTRVSESDINGPTFEILELIKAAGLVPIPFNPLDPASFSQLKLAVQILALKSQPPGFINDFAGDVVPPGWLLCEGAAVGRMAYPALFAAIGTTYGAGDGMTTFNLPDGRSAFRRGLDRGRGIDPGRLLGSTQRGTLQAYDPSQASVTVVGLYNETTDIEAFHQKLSTDRFDGRVVSGVRITSVPASLDGATFADAVGVMRPNNIAMNVCIKY